MRSILLLLSLLTLGSPITAQQTDSLLVARPLEGEGIWSFLRRHQLDPATHLQDFKKLNEGRFDNNGGLYLHRDYLIPVVLKERKEPLFGAEHETVKLIDDRLKGAVFLPGKRTRWPRPRGHRALRRTRLVRRRVRLRHHAPTGPQTYGTPCHRPPHCTRYHPRHSFRYLLAPDRSETVQGETIPLDQLERLQQRARVINQLAKEEKAAYQRCIEIHLDSRSQNKQLDVFFYHHARSKKGRDMAETLRSTLQQNYQKHQPRRGFSGTVSDRNLYMLRRTNPAAVFIELGNIRNFRDQQRFILESNRQALANWLAEGIINDYTQGQ
jgi:N-acetylmuramoyl-L-alanine amidase